jgi:hypothetical protein
MIKERTLYEFIYDTETSRDKKPTVFVLSIHNGKVHAINMSLLPDHEIDAFFEGPYKHMKRYPNIKPRTVYDKFLKPLVTKYKNYRTYHLDKIEKAVEL